MISKVLELLTESLIGRSRPAVVEEITGISRKTFLGGGPKRQRKRDAADDAMRTWFENTLIGRGFTAEEARERRIQVVDGSKGLGPWASLIKAFSDLGQIDCSRTIELASELDAFALELETHRAADDLAAFKQSLLESRCFSTCSDWPFASAGGDAVALSRETLRNASDWRDLDEIVRKVSAAAILEAFARWDVQFLAGYLTDSNKHTGARPRPVFELVMPRIKGHAKRNSDGTLQARGLFRPPLRSLMEVTYCFGTRLYTKKWPRRRDVTRTAIAAAAGTALCDETEQPVAKLYKGLRNLTAREFDQVWSSICGLESPTQGPVAPWPLYVAAQLWTLLWIRKDPEHRIGIVGLTIPAPDVYCCWWNKAYEEERARGVWFGEVPWPPCFNQDD